ncbi:MAG: hypothetical protein ABI402_11670 [Ferruginibacter sp.]
MDYNFFLTKFHNSADRLDKKILHKNKLEVSVGIYVDSVFLKLFKKSWMNNGEEEASTKTKLFFSIWINDKTMQEKKIFYNIHALKLRQLKGYSITSRDFADRFRNKFKNMEQHWENVSVNFGPLTLMEGWVPLNIENMENTIVNLAKNFLMIDHLVDETLKTFEKT